MFDTAAVKITNEVLDIANRLDLCREDDFYFLKDLFGKEVKVAAGAYRIAIIFPTFIVKVSHMSNRSPEYARYSMTREFEFISKARKNPLLQPFFPETKIVKHRRSGAVALLQERIQYIGSGRPPRKDWQYRHFWTSFEQALGISADMHEYNFGWRKVGKDYVPVYVDVDLMD